MLVGFAAARTLAGSLGLPLAASVVIAVAVGTATLFALRPVAERWRVLQVRFPDEYAAHTRTQYSYFGDDGLLRRHLYTVDVLGGAPGANYASEYRAADGVMLATRRRVVAYDEARHKVPEPILISIDLSEIHFE